MVRQAMLIACFLLSFLNKFTCFDNQQKIHLIVVPIRSSDNNITYYKIEGEKITTTTKYQQSWNVFTQSKHELKDSLIEVLSQHEQLQEDIYLVPVFSDDMRLIKGLKLAEQEKKVKSTFDNICQERSKKLKCYTEYPTEEMSQEDEGAFIYTSLLKKYPIKEDYKAYVYLKGSHLSFGIKLNIVPNDANDFPYGFKNDQLLYSAHVDCAGPTIMEHRVAYLVINDHKDKYVSTKEKLSHPCYPKGKEVVIKENSRAEHCYSYRGKINSEIAFLGNYDLVECINYIKRIQIQQSFEKCTDEAFCTLNNTALEPLMEYSRYLTIFVEEGDAEDISKYLERICNKESNYNPSQCFEAVFIKAFFGKYTEYSDSNIQIKKMEEIDYMENYLQNNLKVFIEKFSKRQIADNKTPSLQAPSDMENGNKIDKTLVIALSVSGAAILLVAISAVLILKFYKYPISDIYRMNAKT